MPLALGLVFILLRVTGNPVEASLGDRLSDVELQRRLAISGLNRPIFEQFMTYFESILSWDFGRSFKDVSVNDLIWRHITATIEVSSLGLVVLGFCFLTLGSLAAWKPGGAIDRIIRVSAIVTFALPAFLAASLIQLVFRLFVPAFPTSGRASLSELIRWQTDLYQTGFVTVDALIGGDTVLFFEALAHLLLPAIALVFISGTLIRVFRDSLVQELASEPLQSALRRGVTPRRLFFRHAFMPAIPAALAAYGITVGSLVTGVVFVERVFEIRGLGYLLVDAVLARDFMVVQGIFIVTFFVVAAINVLVDLVIVIVDRRQMKALL